MTITKRDETWLCCLDRAITYVECETYSSRTVSTAHEVAGMAQRFYEFLREKDRPVET